jgi:phage repressor protein C with HTH and peptisase S24 domain
MEKVQVPNSQFFALAKQLLREGKKIEIPVKGGSMRPFLFDGETVVVAPVGVDCPLRKCDIILAETSTGQVMMHRIREISPAGIRMKGDGNLYQSELVRPEDVMGRVLSVVRHGKTISLYTPLGLFLARIWNPVWVRKIGFLLLRLC